MSTTQFEPPMLQQNDGQGDEETQQAQPQGADDYQQQLGINAPFDWSPEPFVECNDLQKGLINSLVTNAARADIASRYLEVSQAWEARLFDRGYQHLVPRAGGGFDLPGANTIWGPLAVADASANYPTNIYGRDKDIIVGALVRELPKVQFFPKDISSPEDLTTADAANKYKYLFEKNGRLRHVLMMMGNYFYTDDRVCLYTRHVLNAPKYGKHPDGTAKGSEETDVLGKLESKVPMQAQEQKEMNFLQLYWDVDSTMAKAKFPWIRNKIQSSTHGLGELGFDKIARISTRQGLYGRIVTGDSLARVITVQYTWLRPMMWYDDQIEDTQRDWFFRNFPDGMLVAYCGQEFAFARNECMDRHIDVVHAYDGVGQNRRSLGSSNIPIQKRLNNFLDLLDDFARRTIPRTWYDAELYSMEAIQQQDNVPGRGSPVQRNPGEPLQNTFAVEQLPQAQPFLYEMAQWYFQDVSASLTGALPTIYGGDAEGEQPTSLMIQRDAAFGRIGTTWNNAKEAFCHAYEHAVMAAAEARKEKITGVGPDGQFIEVDPSMLGGNIYAYSEYDAALPETWGQREMRYTELVQQAPNNPFYAAVLKSPKTMRAVANNIRMADIEVPGESSSRKQLDEIDRMKAAGPLPNPQYVKLETAIVLLGEMGADPTAMQQAQAMLQQIPQQISSVPVAQDASEDHSVEAQTCFEWMNSEEGVKFKDGLAQERLAFQNIYLHWQEHNDVLKKLQKPQPQKPPTVSINFKDMPPEAQVQALREAGIEAQPQQIQNDQLIKTQHKIAEKTVPKTVPETIRTVKRQQ